MMRCKKKSVKNNTETDGRQGREGEGGVRRMRRRGLPTFTVRATKNNPRDDGNDDDGWNRHEMTHCVNVNELHDFLWPIGEARAGELRSCYW